MGQACSSQDEVVATRKTRKERRRENGGRNSGTTSSAASTKGDSASLSMSRSTRSLLSGSGSMSGSTRKKLMKSGRGRAPIRHNEGDQFEGSTSKRNASPKGKKKKTKKNGGIKKGNLKNPDRSPSANKSVSFDESADREGSTASSSVDNPLSGPPREQAPAASPLRVEVNDGPSTESRGGESGGKGLDIGLTAPGPAPSGTSDGYINSLSDIHRVTLMKMSLGKVPEAATQRLTPNSQGSSAQNSTRNSTSSSMPSGLGSSSGRATNGSLSVDHNSAAGTEQSSSPGTSDAAHGSSGLTMNESFRSGATVLTVAAETRRGTQPSEFKVQVPGIESRKESMINDDDHRQPSHPSVVSFIDTSPSNKSLPVDAFGSSRTARTLSISQAQRTRSVQVEADELHKLFLQFGRGKAIKDISKGRSHRFGQCPEGTRQMYIKLEVDRMVKEAMKEKNVSSVSQLSPPFRMLVANTQKLWRETLLQLFTPRLNAPPVSDRSNSRSGSLSTNDSMFSSSSRVPSISQSMNPISMSQLDGDEEADPLANYVGKLPFTRFAPVAALEASVLATARGVEVPDSVSPRRSSTVTAEEHLIGKLCDMAANRPGRIGGENNVSQSEVLPGFFVGSYHIACDADTVWRTGVTHMVSMVGFMPPMKNGTKVGDGDASYSDFEELPKHHFLHPNGFTNVSVGSGTEDSGKLAKVTISDASDPTEKRTITILAFEAQDNTHYELIWSMPAIAAFLHDAYVNKRGTIYVHCGVGVSRAPTATATFISEWIASELRDAIDSGGDEHDMEYVALSTSAEDLIPDEYILHAASVARQVQRQNIQLMKQVAGYSCTTQSGNPRDPDEVEDEALNRTRHTLAIPEYAISVIRLARPVVSPNERFVASLLLHSSPWRLPKKD